MEIKDFTIISTSKKGDKAMIVHTVKGKSVTRHAKRIINGFLWVKNDHTGKLLEDEFFSTVVVKPQDKTQDDILNTIDMVEDDGPA